MMAPIKVGFCSFSTVQEALLHAMKIYEIIKDSPAFADCPEDLLRFLVKDLNDIRDGIAARAVPDEQVAA